MPERKRRRKAGGRRNKIAAREQGTKKYRPYIERNIPYFEILNEEGLALIEKNADILLEEIGIEFRDFPKALDLFKNAGADIVGGKELATKVASEEKLDVDLVISTPEMMADVGQLGKILGPKGLMPNPKTGTVTPNVAKAVEDFKKGKVEIKNDKLGNVHLSIGKVSFTAEDLKTNLEEVIAVITRAKPASSKGEYIKSMYISSTMGPSVSVDINL